MLTRERGIAATVRTEVIPDPINHIDAVLISDEITVAGRVRTVPRSGILASWLIEALQRHSLYAPRLAFAAKEGVLRRSVLGPHERAIYERGYIRAETADTGCRVILRGIDPQVETSFDGPGRPRDAEVSRAMLDTARKLYLSFQNRYRSQEITLEGAVFEIGLGREGSYFVTGCPGVPSTALLTNAAGEPLDYRLIEEGRPFAFIESFENILEGFGVRRLPF